MTGLPWAEIVYPALTFVLLSGYHLYWAWQVRRAPLMTYLGVTRHLRYMWVESIMRERRDILSVQTLRNWIMAASFLASTAMLIGLGLLSFLFRAELLAELNFELTAILTRVQSLFLAKLMLLSLHFFFAFFSFTLAIRYLNQVNFLINVPAACDPVLTPGFIAHTLDLGMLHYTLGMRAYYLAVPVALWLFGPLWMFLGALVLTVVLYHLDHCCSLDYSTATCQLPGAPPEGGGCRETAG